LEREIAMPGINTELSLTIEAFLNSIGVKADNAEARVTLRRLLEIAVERAAEEADKKW